MSIRFLKSLQNFNFEGQATNRIISSKVNHATQNDSMRKNGSTSKLDSFAMDASTPRPWCKSSSLSACSSQLMFLLAKYGIVSMHNNRMAISVTLTEMMPMIDALVDESGYSKSIQVARLNRPVGIGRTSSSIPSNFFRALMTSGLSS